MKTTLSLGLLAAATSFLFACSDDGTADRTPTAGTGGQTGAVGGSGGAPGGGSGGSSAGTAGTAGAGGSGGASTVKLGAALVISDDATVLDTNGTSGINGAAIPVASPVTTLPVLTAGATTGLCISGQTVQLPTMPAQSDYTNNWGASMSLDLNRGANPNAGAADAGSDAGDAGGAVLGQIALPWDPADGEVIGFSFKLVGKDPAITPQAGVPPLMRFQATPEGGVPGTDNFCANLVTTNGTTSTILFSSVVRDCFNPTPGPGVIATPYPPNFTGKLLNIGWQVNSASDIAYKFNFCVTELAPILAP